MALILALLTATLLSAMGSSLLLVADVERLVTANVGYSVEALTGAEAGVERAIVDLRRAADWSTFVSGAATSTFADRRGLVSLPAGGTFDLTARTAELQAQSWPAGAFGANTPAWRLFAWGPLAAMAPRIDSLQYVSVWIADDPADGDGDPSIDQNGVVIVHGESRGPGGSRRVVEATVARTPVGTVRTIAWREVR